MNDISDFIGTDVGSGIFVMRYLVENSDYILIVGSSDMRAVAYALLTHAVDSGANDSIDIRYYDVDKFLADGTMELVRPLPEPEEILTAPDGVNQPRIGRYYSEGGMAWVWLEDLSNFQFNRYSAMSYRPRGVYYTSDGKLTLKAGENEEYVFIIKNNGLELELESTHIEGILEQGMLFTFSRETGYY
jgi:hypothetical protein